MRFTGVFRGLVIGILLIGFAGCRSDDKKAAKKTFKSDEDVSRLEKTRPKELRIHRALPRNLPASGYAPCGQSS